MQFLGFGGAGGAGGAGGSTTDPSFGTGQSWADIQAMMAGYPNAAAQAAAEKGGAGGSSMPDGMSGVNYTPDPFAGLDLSGMGYAGLGDQTQQPFQPTPLVYGTPQAITQGPGSMPYGGAIDYTQEDPFQAASLAEEF